uniref:Odorant receptor n=1 Tax=Anopheles funestus TaxID=62324 RepID=A0A182RG81_ANOFN
MFKLNPKDPKAVMPIVKYLLSLSGFRQDAEHLGRKILPNVFVYIVVLLIPKVFFPYPSRASMIQGLAELIFFTNVDVGFFCLVLQHDHYRQLLNTIDTFINIAYHSTNQKESLPELLLMRLNRNIQKLSVIFCYYIVVTAIIYWTLPCMLTYRSIFKARTIGNASVTLIQYYPNLEETFYWIDNRHTVFGYIVFSIVALVIFSFASYNNATKVLTIVTTIKYCSTLLLLVSITIKDLNRTAAEDIDRELKKAVQMHQLAIRCFTLLNQTLSIVMALQLALCTLTWCLTLLYVFTIGFDMIAMNGLLIMFNMTLEMFGYCFLCTELATTGTQIAHQSYQFRWEQHRPSTQKLVQMIINQGQQPLSLTSWGFLAVNLELFAKVFKTSYSILVVLKDLI